MNRTKTRKGKLKVRDTFGAMIPTPSSKLELSEKDRELLSGRNLNSELQRALFLVRFGEYSAFEVLLQRCLKDSWLTAKLLDKVFSDATAAGPTNLQVNFDQRTQQLFADRQKLAAKRRKPEGDDASI